MRTLVIFLAMVSLALSAELPIYKSFRDIPGVTADEISAIEALQKEHKFFNYGMTLTTEAFLTGNGKVNGYAALLCEWLSELFGIQFKPEVYAWNDLLENLNSGNLAFAGNLIITDERKQMYHMTDIIAKRQYKMMRLKGSQAIARIAMERPPRYAFLSGAAHGYNVAAVTDPYTYEFVWVDDYTEVYNVLRSGEADAFIAEDAMEASFTTYDSIYIEDFLPLIFSSIAMATAKDELKPVISVITKALQGDATPYLNHLFNKGYDSYKKHKFYTLLNDEEKEYLQNTSSVPIAAQFFTYPSTFYNTYEKKWEGIAFDLLAEVGKLTGLSFNVVNEPHDNLPVLLEMLADGRAHVLPELFFSKERSETFLRTENTIVDDHYALLSKSKYPNASLNEIPSKRIGLVKNSARSSLFRSWFPNAHNITEYESDEDSYFAVENGEVDLVMSSKNRLLAIVNYYELSDYKVNYTFQPFESTFGLNKEQAILCSIMDKALSLIDINAISEPWMTKTYDYKKKMMEAQLPWLIGVAILLLAMLIFVLLFQRGKRRGQNLEKQVGMRTAELKAVIDNYKGVIWSVDPEKNITIFGGQYLKKIGVDPAFLIGKNLERARDKNRHLDIIERVGKTYKEGAQDWISEIDGGYFHSNTTPVFNTEGSVIGVVGSNDDMTELITLQRNLETAVKDAQAANRAKSSFLASMSHEIRTPMNAILGITEIQLQNGNLSADTKNALNVVYNSGYTLLGIINDLLDLSKIEAGKMELVNNRYETASMINDTINLNTARVGSKPIEFKLSVSEDLPYEIIGDELRVKQILNNLLSNAFKYTDSGEVDLSFSAETIGEKVMLIVTVKDTGQGMNEEQVQSLFDAYARFNTKVNRFVEGTGLGMNIVQHLVKQMSGDIFVKSTLGKGTEITVHLTQGYASSTKLGGELAENLMKFKLESMSKLDKAQIVREHMPYGRVLVVDDMETNLYVAKGFLLPYELIIDTALSGGEAIEKIKRGNVYDIIFMDHMMPVMDGIEAVKKIRGMNYTHPIVALTANAVAGQSEMFLANGFDGFISKPIDIRELNASLNKFVRNKQHVEASGMPQVDVELAKIFIQDAEKVMAVLESNESEDLQTYIINVHALKSALANIGETKLSDFAKELEQAGRDKNTSFISEKTKTFLSELRAVVDKLKPIAGEYGKGKVSDEDKEHLRKTLLLIKGACEAYDVNAAMALLKELKKKAWPSPYGELLDTITKHLLHSDFDEAGAVCEI